MAITDFQLFLSGDSSDLIQDIATTTSETISVSVIDLSSPGMTGLKKQVGEGRPLYFNILVTEAVTHGSALNVTFRLRSHTTVATNSGVEHVAVTKAKADLTIGTHIRIPVPPVEMSRYLGASHQCSATTATAGKFQMWIDLG